VALLRERPFDGLKRELDIDAFLARRLIGVARVPKRTKARNDEWALLDPRCGLASVGRIAGPIVLLRRQAAMDVQADDFSCASSSVPSRQNAS
jgi:hypothetical protein